MIFQPSSICCCRHVAMLLLLHKKKLPHLPPSSRSPLWESACHKADESQSFPTAEEKHV